MSLHRVWVYGDNVNTDVIFPGKYTYTLRTPESIAEKALEDLDPEFAQGVQEGDIIVAGENWGNGSSREQAVTCLKYNGVRTIIAASFGGLYFRNCINQGVHPIICPELTHFAKTGDMIELDVENNQIVIGEQHFVIPALPSQVQAIIDAGGLVAMLQRKFGNPA